MMTWASCPHGVRTRGKKNLDDEEPLLAGATARNCIVPHESNFLSGNSRGMDFMSVTPAPMSLIAEPRTSQSWVSHAVAFVFQMKRKRERDRWRRQVTQRSVQDTLRTHTNIHTHIHTCNLEVCIFVPQRNIHTSNFNVCKFRGNPDIHRRQYFAYMFPTGTHIPPVCYPELFSTYVSQEHTYPSLLCF